MPTNESKIMKQPIEQCEQLALYPQIAALVYQLLDAAQAGGMTESRAKKIYNEILGSLANIDGRAFWPFRDELIRLLRMPDGFFDSADDDGSTSWHLN